MLRRSFFAQKRHLEATSVKCRCLTHSLVYNNGQGSTSSTQSSTSALPKLSKTPDEHIPPTIHGPKNPAEWHSKSSTPPEFSRVVVALDCNQSLDKISQFIRKSPLLLELFSRPRKIRKIAEELARSPKPHHSIQILNLTHHLGYTLYASAYESISFHVAQSRKWDIVLGVVGAARQHTQHVTLKLLNWRARALMETQQYSHLRHILGEFEAAGIIPTQMTYHILLTGCMRNNDMERAKGYLQDMKDAGIPVDSTTHSLINSYRKFGLDPQVRDNALASLPSLPPAARTNTVNHVIQSALDMDDLTRVFHYLSMFKAGSVGIIASFFSSQNEFKQAMKISAHLPESLQLNVMPNSDTFAICMNYFIKKGNPELATQLGNESLTMRIPASSGLVTSLVHAYFLQDQGDTAIRMLSQLCCASYSKGWDSLMVHLHPRQQFPLLNPTQLSLTTRMCNALLRGSLDRQGLSSVPSIFVIMHANNITPNGRTIEIILSYMNKMNVAHPRTMFQSLRALTVTPSVRPSISHLHTITSRIFRDEKQAGERSAWSRSSVSRKRPLPGHRPREKPQLLGITEAFDPTGGIQLGTHLSYRTAAKPTIQSLASREVKTDSAMLFLRIRRQSVLHHDLESAYRFFRTLTARGMRPNAYHYGALVEGYALAGEFTSAMEVIRMAKNSGVNPNVVMYTTIITAYARRRDPSSALRTFKEMAASGIAPDVASVDALVSAFYSRGEEREARDVLRKLWVYLQPFPESLESADFQTLLSHFRSLNSTSKKTKFTKSGRIEIFHQVRRMIRTYRRYFGSRSRPQKAGREKPRAQNAIKEPTT